MRFLKSMRKSPFSSRPAAARVLTVEIIFFVQTWKKRETIKLMKPPLDKINGRRAPANDRKKLHCSSIERCLSLKMRKIADQKMIGKTEEKLESYLKLIKQLEDENEELYRHNVQLTRRLQEKRPEKELIAGFERSFEKMGLSAPPFSCAKRLLNALTEKIAMVSR